LHAQCIPTTSAWEGRREGWKDREIERGREGDRNEGRKESEHDMSSA